MKEWFKGSIVGSYSMNVLFWYVSYFIIEFWRFLSNVSIELWIFVSYFIIEFWRFASNIIIEAWTAYSGVYEIELNENNILMEIN